MEFVIMKDFNIFLNKIESFNKCTADSRSRLTALIEVRNNTIQVLILFSFQMLCRCQCSDSSLILLMTKTFQKPVWQLSSSHWFSSTAFHSLWLICKILACTLSGIFCTWESSFPWEPRDHRGRGSSAWASYWALQTHQESASSGAQLVIRQDKC